MQEEVTQKTATFCIPATKTWYDLLKKVLAASASSEADPVEKKDRKISLKQGKVNKDKELAKQNAGMVNIEITDKISSP